MEMQDIRSDGLKQGAEGPDAEESGDAFLPIGIRMWREPSFSRRGTRRPPPETTIFSTPREERPLPSSITTCSTPPDSMEGTRCTIFIRRGAEGKIWRGCSLLHGPLPEAGNREPSGGSSVFPVTVSSNHAFLFQCLQAGQDAGFAAAMSARYGKDAYRSAGAKSLIYHGDAVLADPGGGGVRQMPGYPPRPGFLHGNNG